MKNATIQHGLDPDRDFCCHSCKDLHKVGRAEGYCHHHMNKDRYWGPPHVVATDGCRYHSEMISTPGKPATKPLVDLQAGLTAKVARALNDLRYHLGHEGEYTVVRYDREPIGLEGLMLGDIFETIDNWLNPVPADPAEPDTPEGKLSVN